MLAGIFVFSRTLPSSLVFKGGVSEALPLNTRGDGGVLVAKQDKGGWSKFILWKRNAGLPQ
jgi:hypothetical protein